MGYRLNFKKRLPCEQGEALHTDTNRVYENQFIKAFRLTNEEFDFIAKYSTYEELEILLAGTEFGFSHSRAKQQEVNYSEKKLMLQTLSSLLERYYLQMY